MSRRAYLSCAAVPGIPDTTLGEEDCAALRVHAFDLRCAVSRLWVQYPCTDDVQNASLKACIQDLMPITDRLCSVANKTSAPHKECGMVTGE